MLPSRWSLLLITLFFATAAVGRAQTSGKKADPLAEEAPAYNDIVARSFLIEVEPLIEKHTGWDCHWPLPFRLLTRAQYVDSLLKEIKDKHPGALHDQRSEAMLRLMLESQSAGLLGYYSTLTKSLFLLPGNLKPSLRRLHVEERYARGVIELIAAHELTHAVQDAHYHIADYSMRLTNPEEQDAWTMIVEGHASWVADRVAEDLHLEEGAQLLAEKLAAANPPTRRQGEHENANMRGYIAGKKFIEQVFAKGGIKAVQALFEHPPQSTTDIENPELFFLHTRVARER
jgi:hypothetical protein